MSSARISLPTKREKKEAMARKREERAIRAAHRKQKQAQSYLQDDQNFVSFKTQLNAIGLEIKDIPGDGNCLFRALGDQMDGHGKNHLKHRQDVVEYMLQHKQDFEPFVEDDVPFQRHVNNLKKPGTYAGNDAIVAFSRLHDVTVVIHQMNSPVWQIHGSDSSQARQLHISYHNGEHYSSVRKISDTSSQPTNIKMGELTTGKGSMKTTSGKEQEFQYYDNFQDDYEEEMIEFGGDVSGVVNDNGYYCEADMTPRVSQCDADGVARVTRTADDYVQTVMAETGCQDVNLIQETLEENCYDLNATVSNILMIMQFTEYDQNDSASTMSRSEEDSGIWSTDGTGSRLFGDAVPSQNGAKPKHNNTNSKLSAKEKKAEKKARAAERHKQRLLGQNGAQGGASNYGDNPSHHHHPGYTDEETHIVQTMGALVI